jgi:hypothetical protein
VREWYPHALWHGTVWYTTWGRDTRGEPARRGAAAFCIIDDDAGSILSGLDIGFCDALVALGCISNEQQAFSRVLRMGTRGARHVAHIVRVAFEDPEVLVRLVHPFTGGRVLAAEGAVTHVRTW